MHKLNELLDRKAEKRPCDKSCKNYTFEHRDVACVLSDVYSVAKGEMCAIHTEIKVINVS